MLDRAVKIKGKVQHYAWGGTRYIPHLLKIKNTHNEPFAEYWIGVHPRGDATVIKGADNRPLSEYVDLPFLLKILDVDDMLSIQSHPTKAQAEVGYAREHEAAIPLDAKHRIFKDQNHKPELMVAESDFWLLHGFQSLRKIKAIIERTPEFAPLLELDQSSIHTFYSDLMTMADDRAAEILNQLRERLSAKNTDDKDDPDYWAQRGLAKYGNDRGIFSIYFFNLVRLSKGQAIYQEAGIPHAYLYGQNIEIMANSDNVFRAGLTPKHMDIPVLLAHLDYSPIVPSIIEPAAIDDNEVVYKSPAHEFEVRVLTVDVDAVTRRSSSDECLLLLEGKVGVKENDLIFGLERGESIFVPKDKMYEIRPQQKSRIIRAVVPK